MATPRVQASKYQARQLALLAKAVGDFIRYWGFRRIHGELWTLLFLAPQPLSPTDMAKSLGVSKALVSTALPELEHYQLIYQVPSENEKVKRYHAAQDVFPMVREILRTRERSLLHRVSVLMDALESSLQSPGSEVCPKRFSELQRMTRNANAIFDFLVKTQLEKLLRHV